MDLVWFVIVSIVLLFLVLWKGKVVNNAQSWIFGVQPAEFIKLGVIIVLAVFFRASRIANIIFTGL
ncbi:FtsW/RodA/SpoVE family cell cycle protein [Bacillus thuringiensis]|nr:FtsW/RodA/SpoVE family cell cycle protein [Bacillus thuringiensis]